MSFRAFSGESRDHLVLPEGDSSYPWSGHVCDATIAESRSRSPQTHIPFPEPPLTEPRPRNLEDVINDAFNALGQTLNPPTPPPARDPLIEGDTQLDPPPRPPSPFIPLSADNPGDAPAGGVPPFRPLGESDRNAARGSGVSLRDALTDGNIARDRAEMNTLSRAVEQLQREVRHLESSMGVMRTHFTSYVVNSVSYSEARINRRVDRLRSMLGQSSGTGTAPRATQPPQERLSVSALHTTAPNLSMQPQLPGQSLLRRRRGL
jgi:hypothetical protein